ncbi:MULTISPECIES: GGDEF domain-containing protein [unclassified Methylobacterium]|uniref:GGDEF domain-containing protein n=1 Tax=unclassified Methylobacterium TaxID=2615210 RepID=UPI0036F6E98C
MLDFSTLQVASISSRLAFIVVFLVTLSRHPSELYFGIWASALGCSLIASFIMLGDPSTIPLHPLKGAVVYALYGASLSASWIGLRLFYERPASVPPAIALALGPGILYGLSLQAGIATPWSLTTVFVLIAVSTGLCILEILKTPAQSRLWTQYIVLLGFLGYFSAFILSIAVIHFASEHLASPESGVYSLLFDQWCGVFIQVGYLAMVGERAHLRLSLLAETDPLTGLANRRGLRAAMSRRAAGRAGTAGCAVLLADIDRFKSINDTHGHEGGDAVLVGVAERLRSVMRKDDLIARWGGEEFLVVLDRTDDAQAVLVAERLRAAVAGQPILLGGTSIAVTASVGASVGTASEVQIDAAVARADAALYAAKNGGRNQVRLEPPPAPPPAAAGATRIPVSPIEPSQPIATAIAIREA